MIDFFNLSQFILPILLVIIGFITGRRIEYNHWRTLASSEKNLAHIKVEQMDVPMLSQAATHYELVVGHAVIAEDAFKSFLAKLVQLFGGEIRAYQRLLDRARRQAIIRMQLEASAMGCQHIINVRLQSANINSGQKVAVQVFVYVIAIK